MIDFIFFLKLEDMVKNVQKTHAKINNDANKKPVGVIWLKSTLSDFVLIQYFNLVSIKVVYSIATGMKRNSLPCYCRDGLYIDPKCPVKSFCSR